MTPSALMDAVRRAGGSLHMEDGRLIARNIPSELLDDLRQHRDAVSAYLEDVAVITAHLPAHQTEVVAMLRQDPALRYAYTTRNQGENVIVTLAIRDVAVADLSIPLERYDGFEFMRIMQEEFS